MILSSIAAWVVALIYGVCYVVSKLLNFNGFITK